LRQAIARGHLNFGWMRNDPDMASLRDNPEFIALTSGQIAPDEPGKIAQDVAAKAQARSLTAKSNSPMVSQ
jgi:hypothetical protein